MTNKISRYFNFPERKKVLLWSGWFLLTNLALALLISSRYMSMMEFPETIRSWLFLITATIGHFAALSIFPFLLFWVFTYAAPHRYLSQAGLIALSSLLLSILVIDTFVYRQYRFHLNLLILDMLLKGGDQIIDLPFSTWLLIGAGLLFLLFLETALGILVWKKLGAFSGKKYGYAISLVLVSCFFLYNFIHMIADANNDVAVKRLTLQYPLMYPITARHLMTKYGFVDEKAAEKNKRLAATEDSRSLHVYPAKDLQFDGRPNHPNILFIVLDSWRYDAMTPDITPNIHQFTEKAIVFNNHLSGGNATRTGIFSLFYGLPGTYWHAFKKNQRGPVLMDALLHHGYRFGIFASAPLTSPAFHLTVFSRINGFSLKIEGAKGYERDQEVVKRWLNWLSREQSDANHKPFFGFLFLDGLHGYSYPKAYPRHFLPSLDVPNYPGLSNDTDPLPFRNLYNNIAHFQDALVADVLDDLQEKNLLDQTFIIITGDHGQEFNDTRKNYWGHNSNFSKYQLQVPLLIHAPGRPAGVFEARSSHFDIVPTIMNNVLGCTNAPEDYSVGRDLFDKDRRPLDFVLAAGYNEFAIVGSDNIIVKNKIGLYDVFDSNYNKQSADNVDWHLFDRALQQISIFLK